MIDFVKIRVQNPNIKQIRENLCLEWELSISERTGEVKEIIAKYHNLTFKIVCNQYLNISGSLHKFWNSINGRGEQNYNDFMFSDLAEVINEICDSFNLNPSSCMIENIEFGVNITPPFPVKEILRSIINHKGKPFTQEYDEKKYYRECKRQQYIIKVYDKGLQFNQGNILRFEDKTRKMEHLKGIGIKSFTDLLNPVKINQLGAVLRKDFEGLLIYDYTIPLMKLNPRERLILTEGQTPAYWLNLLESNPNLYYKRRDRFKELIKKYGTQDIQNIIGELIIQKWNELLTCTPKTLQNLTGVENIELTEINHSSIGLKDVNKGNEAEGSGKEPPRRYCLSCGKDISHQRRNSKFCSEKYVGYSQARRCRNNDSNSRHRIKRLIKQERESLTLFDSLPFIRTSYQWERLKEYIVNEKYG